MFHTGSDFFYTFLLSFIWKCIFMGILPFYFYFFLFFLWIFGDFNETDHSILHSEQLLLSQLPFYIRDSCCQVLGCYYRSCKTRIPQQSMTSKHFRRDFPYKHFRAVLLNTCPLAAKVFLFNPSFLIIAHNLTHD